METQKEKPPNVELIEEIPNLNNALRVTDSLSISTSNLSISQDNNLQSQIPQISNNTNDKVIFSTIINQANEKDTENEWMTLLYTNIKKFIRKKK